MREATVTQPLPRLPGGLDHSEPPVTVRGRDVAQACPADQEPFKAAELGSCPWKC